MAWSDAARKASALARKMRSKGAPDKRKPPVPEYIRMTKKDITEVGPIADAIRDFAAKKLRAR